MASSPWPKAIRGWDRRNVYYFQMLSSLAAHYGMDLDLPFGQLQDKHRKLVLNGTGTEKVSFRYMNDRGDVVRREHPFEGILPNLERRYRETESSSVREELAKYLSTQPCPDCSGTRLRREARHVFIDGRNLPGVTTMPVGAAAPILNNCIWTAAGARSRKRSSRKFARA